MQFIKDLFGWFKPSPKARVPDEHGTLPYRCKGGPLDGEVLYLRGEETLTFRLNTWHGRYVKATSHTLTWRNE